MTKHDDMAAFFGVSTARLDVGVVQEDAPDDDRAAFRRHAAGAVEPFTEAMTARPDTSPTPGMSLAVAHAIRSHLLDRQDRPVARDACRVVSPPFDTTDVDNGYATKAGHLRTWASDKGSSMAAVGTYLRVDTEVDVTITPRGTYSGRVAAFAADRDWACSAGLGLTVYLDRRTTPALSREASLWSFTGAEQFTGRNVDGSFADAPSAGVLGPSPLAPVLVHARPRQRVLVWAWAWLLSSGADSGSLAFLNVDLTRVDVCPGPPLVI